MAAKRRTAPKPAAPKAAARKVPGLGTLRFKHGAWVSAAVPVAFFAGKRLPFSIEVDDDASGGDAFGPEVAAAVAAFLALDEADRVSATKAVFASYVEMVKLIGDVAELGPLPKSRAGEIWKSVMPMEIRVVRRTSDRKRADRDVYVLASSEIEWEPEHGLQLSFHRGAKLVRVSEQDGHAREEDA